MTTPITNRQSGAALITVLMIVAAMSAVALGLSQTVMRATLRAKAFDAQVQSNWYAVAAEQFALSAIADINRQHEGRLFAGAPGLDTPVTFTIDGGSITAVTRDATNCFNLNRLARGTRPSTDFDAALTFYGDLISATELGSGRGEGLTAALVDWMDADTTPATYGAEDAYYAGLDVPYRTSGQPLANLSELSAIRNYLPGVIEVLKPNVCVRPANEVHKLNINTLRAEQAPLLVAQMSGLISLEDARQLIAARPFGGWQNVGDFLKEPAIAKIAADYRNEDTLSVTATHMDVKAHVTYRGRVKTVHILFRTAPGEVVRTLSRQEGT